MALSNRATRGMGAEGPCLVQLGMGPRLPKKRADGAGFKVPWQGATQQGLLSAWPLCVGAQAAQAVRGAGDRRPGPARLGLCRSFSWRGPGAGIGTWPRAGRCRSERGHRATAGVHGGFYAGPGWFESVAVCGDTPTAPQKRPVPGVRLGLNQPLVAVVGAPLGVVMAGDG